MFQVPLVAVVFLSSGSFKVKTARASPHRLAFGRRRREREGERVERDGVLGGAGHGFGEAEVVLTSLDAGGGESSVEISDFSG